MAQNITMSFDAKTLAFVKDYAKETRTSVNGLVREFFNTIAEKERRRQNHADFMKAITSIQGNSGGWKFDREEINERR